MTESTRPSVSGPLGPLGPLGRRLLLAFVAVAGVAVVLVVAAAMVGTSRGLSSAQRSQRDEVAVAVARTTAQAYGRAGGWDGADLSAALSLAEAAGARAAVRSADGRLLAATGTRPGGMGNGTGGTGNGTGNGMGGMGNGLGGMGPGITRGAGSVTLPVIADGLVVGTITVGFGPAAANAGRTIAWMWIVAAAVVAALAALALGYWISRLLTRPVVALTEAARAFGAGDRGARPAVRGHGELGELAVAFEEAAGTVARSEEMRRQMAADVAHELRTPLAALRAGLEELRDGLTPAGPVALARLHDQSLRLARVVDDLSELSSAEASTLGMEVGQVDLEHLVRSEASAGEAQLRSAGLSLTVAVDARGPATVLGDETRLRQVVGNLLQNCARHCREGDAVSVLLDGPLPVTPTQDRSGTRGTSQSWWRVVVADTGPGIAAENLPHVFARFWRGTPGDGNRDGTGGSGLGLAVVQALVHAHGGRVGVDSDGRSGTTVTVELPAEGPRG